MNTPQYLEVKSFLEVTNFQKNAGRLFFINSLKPVQFPLNICAGLGFKSAPKFMRMKNIALF